jgi:hypothetical protein
VKLIFSGENIKDVEIIKIRKVIPFSDNPLLKKEKLTETERKKVDELFKKHNKLQEKEKWKIYK